MVPRGEEVLRMPVSSRVDVSLFGFLGFSAIALFSMGCRIEGVERLGMHAIGEGCAKNSQCESEVCSADVERGTCGMCVSQRKIGESCDGEFEGCSPSATCARGICVTNKIAVGGACEVGPKGDDKGDCDDEAACMRSGTTNGRDVGICVDRPGVGEACGQYPTPPCDIGTACEDEICVPLRERTEGESCDQSPCAEGLFCRFSDRTCRVPTLLEGEPCGIDQGAIVDNDCAGGMACGNLQYPDGGGGPVPHTCLPRPEKGSPCIFGKCADGLFCENRQDFNGNWETPRCNDRLDEGQACNVVIYIAPTEDCAAGLECRANKCQPACE
jgi:hypothetical protein